MPLSLSLSPSHFLCLFQLSSHLHSLWSVTEQDSICLSYLSTQISVDVKKKRGRNGNANTPNVEPSARRTSFKRGRNKPKNTAVCVSRIVRRGMPRSAPNPFRLFEKLWCFSSHHWFNRLRSCLSFQGSETSANTTPSAPAWLMALPHWYEPHMWFGYCITCG